MIRVRVESFGISLDGYGAGVSQDLEHPLGIGGVGLQQWLVPTRTFQRVHEAGDGTTRIVDDFATRGFKNIGAWIVGRSMFGPIRGSWSNLDWKDRWGDSPPFHVPVFVLTHHARPPVEMLGGTTFDFFTGGVHETLERAPAVVNGKDVRVGESGPHASQTQS